MKKIILLTSILLTINIHATDKTTCENLFKNAISNFYLENSCKFDKHVASSIRKDFKNQGCESIVTQDDMKKLNSIVLGDSYKKMNEIGKDNFCKNNKLQYDNLQTIY